MRDAIAGHAAIVETVLARDAGRAITLMDAHLLATEQGAAALLDAGPKQPTGSRA